MTKTTRSGEGASNGDQRPSLRALPGSRFRYVDVTSPGAEGTINLMWGDYPIQWINNLTVAAEIKAHLDSENVKRTNEATRHDQQSNT